MQNTIDTYDRAYKKVQDIAGGVDGIIEIVMIIAKLLNSFFFHNYQTIIDFHFELEKDDLRNKPRIKLNNSNLNGSKISYKKDFNKYFWIFIREIYLLYKGKKLHNISL